MKADLQRVIVISSAKPKFRVVDGQVILIEASSIPKGKSPEQHVRDNWNITSEYQLLPIPNCMLRGVLGAKDGDSDTVKKPSNQTVYLTKDNMPTHMHHSSVTTGAHFPTICGSSSG